MAHSTLGPSKAKQWLNCPGSIALCARAPKRPTSVNAAEGTVAHSLCEKFHTGKLDTLELMALLGTTIKQDGFDIEVTEEMVDAVIEYHENIVADIEALAADDRSKGVESHTEVRVKAPSVDESVWGTADKVLFRKGHKLIVRDFKFGKGVGVEVEENDQMCLYAIAVMDTLAGWAFDEVELVVDQPRKGGETRWSTTPAWLKEYAAKAKAAAAETRKPDAKVEAGDWCRWCDARPFCPAQHQLAQTSAMVAFGDPLPPAPLTTPEARLAQVRLMTLPDLVKAYRHKEMATSFFTAVADVLNERLSAGEVIEGVKLVEGRSNRQWRDESEVEAKYGSTFGEKIYEPKKLLSPAKLEKALGNSKAIKADIAGLTVKPEGKRTVALASDPRPAVRSSAQEAFGVVDEGSCPECDIMGFCEKHPAAGGALKKGPIWPTGD